MGYHERTSEQWYEEASRCYLEGHQACAWCGAPHQVFRIETDGGVNYHCIRCEFHAGHDGNQDRYQFVPGVRKPGSVAPLTMHG